MRGYGVASDAVQRPHYLYHDEKIERTEQQKGSIDDDDCEDDEVDARHVHFALADVVLVEKQQRPAPETFANRFVMRTKWTHAGHLERHEER